MSYPNPRLVNRVERTEKKKFKKVPTLHTTRQKQNYNIVHAHIFPRTHKKTVIKTAKVFLHARNYGKRRRGSGEAQVTLLHELRENLLTQHNPRISDRKVHKRAMSMEKKDWKWLK